MRITEADIRRMVSESVGILMEKMQVWGDEDVNNFINQVYNDCKEYAKTAREKSEFTMCKCGGGYMQEIPVWRPRKKYVINYMGKPVNVFVNYNQPPMRNRDGLQNETQIILNITYDASLGEIKNTIYHEFNHEYSDRMKAGGEYKSPYYDDKTFDLLIYGKNGYAKWQNQYTKAVDDVLYRLWSREERDSYIANAVSLSYKGIQAYINDIRKSIDLLEKSKITYQDKFSNGGEKSYEQYFWERIQELVTQRGYKYNDNSRGDYSQMTWEKFKRIFITRSRDILEKYARRLINNWYYYQENVNNGVGIKNYHDRMAQDNNTQKRISEGKGYLLANIDTIVNGLHAIYEGSRSVTYEDNYICVNVYCKTRWENRWERVSTGVRQMANRRVFPREKAYFEVENGKATFNFYIRNEKQFNGIDSGVDAETRNATYKDIIKKELKEV